MADVSHRLVPSHGRGPGFESRSAHHRSSGERGHDRETTPKPPRNRRSRHENRTTRQGPRDRPHGPPENREGRGAREGGLLSRSEECCFATPTSGAGGYPAPNPKPLGETSSRSRPQSPTRQYCAQRWFPRDSVGPHHGARTIGKLACPPLKVNELFWPTLLPQKLRSVGPHRPSFPY